LVDKRNGTTHEFTLQNETAQVDELHIIKAFRIAVIGRVLANTSIVSIVNSHTGRLIDSFYCFYPTVSPDRRLVAYVKVFPAHFVEGTSAEYLLYDFELSPQENRPSSKAASLGDHMNVGFPIYPPGSLNLPSDNVLVAADKTHTIASDGFFWSKDSKMLGFADLWGRSTSVILADLSVNPHRPRIATKTLPWQTILAAGKCPEYQPDPIRALRVASMTFLDAEPTRLRLGFRFPNPACLAENSLTIDASQ